MTTVNRAPFRRGEQVPFIGQGVSSFRLAAAAWRSVALLRCPIRSCPSRFARRSSLSCTAQSKGFGSSKAASKAKRPKYRGKELGEGWFKVANVSDFKEGKQTKPIILANNQAIMLYKVGNEVYSSEANSTAYQFPLTDAKILQREAGPAVEVPLDGTVYDLATGAVIDWCPTNNPARKLLGALKKAAKSIPLKVYPAVTDDQGNILVKC